jgi:hypothetical protein
MKLIKITLVAVMLVTSAHAGWWSDSEEEKRIKQIETELNEQRSKTGTWEIIAGVLAVGCVLVFSIGAAMGSRARREVRRHETTD